MKLELEISNFYYMFRKSVFFHYPQHLLSKIQDLEGSVRTLGTSTGTLGMFLIPNLSLLNLTALGKWSYAAQT